jgi:hypothetical protein
MRGKRAAARRAHFFCRRAAWLRDADAARRGGGGGRASAALNRREPLQARRDASDKAVTCERARCDAANVCAAARRQLRAGGGAPAHLGAAPRLFENTRRPGGDAAYALAAARRLLATPREARCADLQRRRSAGESSSQESAPPAGSRRLPPAAATPRLSTASWWSTQPVQLHTPTPAPRALRAAFGTKRQRAACCLRLFTPRVAALPAAPAPWRRG